jgi:hypothetical protein
MSENKTPNIHVLSLAQYEKPQISESKKGEWVQYGENNNYYKFLIERYANSTTNNAVINGISRLIYGKGLSALDAARKPNEYAQFITMFKAEEVRKFVTDLKMLGQCAIQITYKGKLVDKVTHLPIQNLCPEKCDKDGKINRWYYSDNWNDIKDFPPTPIDVFGNGANREVLIVQPYSVGMKYFSNVDYQGGLPYATLEEEIAQYLITETQNSFSGTKIVNVNGGRYTDEQQDEISAKINSKLTGSKGQKVIVAFNESAELSTKVEDIPLTDAPQHYQYLSTESRDKILLSHNVTSPLIFGIITGTGFSSNSEELKTGFTIFDNTIIRNFQDILIDAFNRILAVNEISLKLYFKTLNPFESKIEEVQDVADSETTLSSQKTLLDEILESCEDDTQEGWKVIDERDVELDDEDELNKHIDKLNSSVKLSLVDKIVNLVSTGTARPTAISTQDKLVKEKYFKVRYKYVGNPSPDREFCKKMLSANKLYRKEDIDRMSAERVNSDFAEFGKNSSTGTYDIFKFKGGARCHHKWSRVTMMLDLNEDSEKFKEIGTAAAAVKGFKVTNPYQVSIYPNNLPLKGFSPNNKNLPSDV